MIPVLRLAVVQDAARAEALLRRLRLDPRDVALRVSDDDENVRRIMADVAGRGDEALRAEARDYSAPRMRRP